MDDYYLMQIKKSLPTGKPFLLDPELIIVHKICEIR